MNWLLDTNIVLYFLSGRLTQALPAGVYHCSIISEIELLSYPSLDPAAEQQIRHFLDAIALVGLSQPIKLNAIRLRRHLSLKVPDAIIVATAVELNAELLTNDARLLGTRECKSRSLPLKKS